MSFGNKSRLIFPMLVAFFMLAPIAIATGCCSSSDCPGYCSHLSGPNTAPNCCSAHCDQADLGWCQCSECTSGGGGGHDPVGNIDSADCYLSTGWTCDADAFNTPLTVKFYADGTSSTGTLIGSVEASGTREQAVANNCGGNANHGFAFDIPDSVKDGKTHTIYAYAVNTGGGSNKLLIGSPKTISGCTIPCVANQPVISSVSSTCRTVKINWGFGSSNGPAYSQYVDIFDSSWNFIDEHDPAASARSDTFTGRSPGTSYYESIVDYRDDSCYDEADRLVTTASDSCSAFNKWVCSSNTSRYFCKMFSGDCYTYNASTSCGGKPTVIACSGNAIRTLNACNNPCSGNGICGSCTQTATNTSCGSLAPYSTCSSGTNKQTNYASCNKGCSDGACTSCSQAASTASCGTSSCALDYCSANQTIFYNYPATCNNGCNGAVCAGACSCSAAPTLCSGSCIANPGAYQAPACNASFGGCGVAAPVCAVGKCGATCDASHACPIGQACSSACTCVSACTPNQPKITGSSATCRSMTVNWAYAVGVPTYSQNVSFFNESGALILHINPGSTVRNATFNGLLPNSSYYSVVYDYQKPSCYNFTMQPKATTPTDACTPGSWQCDGSNSQRYCGLFGSANGSDCYSFNASSSCGATSLHSGCSGKNWIVYGTCQNTCSDGACSACEPPVISSVCNETCGCTGIVVPTPPSPSTIPTAFSGQTDAIIDAPFSTSQNNATITVTTYLNGALVCSPAPVVAYGVGNDVKAAAMIGTCANGLSAFLLDTTIPGIYKVSVLFDTTPNPSGKITRTASIERYAENRNKSSAPDFGVILVPAVAAAAIFAARRAKRK